MTHEHHQPSWQSDEDGMDGIARGAHFFRFLALGICLAAATYGLSYFAALGWTEGRRASWAAEPAE